MIILKAHFKATHGFLERYQADLPAGGLFIPTRKSVAIGEPVVISVRLGSRGSPVLLRGVVAWRRPGIHRE